MDMVGFGTYFGLIFVFLKSSPTIEVPLGMITPPSVLLNLRRTLFGSDKSKFVFKSKNILSFPTTAPFTSTN